MRRQRTRSAAYRARRTIRRAAKNKFASFAAATAHFSKLGYAVTQSDSIGWQVMEIAGSNPLRVTLDMTNGLRRVRVKEFTTDRALNCWVPRAEAINSRAEVPNLSPIIITESGKA